MPYNSATLASAKEPITYYYFLQNRSDIFEISCLNSTVNCTWPSGTSASWYNSFRYFNSNTFHTLLIAMFTSSPGCQNQTAKPMKNPRAVPICCDTSSSQQGPSTSEGDPEGCEFFNATNFHRFHVPLFKLSSPKLNDQTDSDSLINTLLLHMITQDHSQNTFNDQNNTDIEKFEKEVNNVFTQIKLDTSSETEGSRQHK